MARVKPRLGLRSQVRVGVRRRVGAVCAGQAWGRTNEYQNAQVVAGVDEGAAQRKALEALVEHQRRGQRPDGARALRHAQRDADQDTAATRQSSVGMLSCRCMMQIMWLDPYDS